MKPLMHLRVLLKTAAMLLCAAMVLPMLASCAVSLENPEPSLLANISIKPQKYDDAGVALDSGFLISSTLTLSAQGLKKYLTAEPAFDFEISSGEGGFILKPQAPLTENTVYGFTLGSQDGRTRTWAFQTRRPFSILSVSPVDNSQEVYTYASIEVITSHYGTDLTDYLEINPPVAGNFTNAGGYTYFYPNEGFAPSTRYTVTIKKGLESPVGDILPEDYIFSFTTGKDSGKSYSNRTSGIFLWGEYAETFLSSDTPIVTVGAFDENRGKGAPSTVNTTVSVYRMSGSERYMEALNARAAFLKEGGSPESYMYQSDTLSHVVSFDTPIFRLDEYTEGGYVVFPQTLSKGYYAVNVTGTLPNGASNTIQKLLQISDVSVFSQSVNGQTLVWLNDAASGESITGATVGVLEEGKLNPAVSAQTGTDGTALLSTGKLEGGTLFAKVDADNEFVEPVIFSAQAEPSLDEQYYSFLYKDREIYRPTDTVSFWGKVLPRKSGIETPKQLTARLTSHRWDSYLEINEVIDEIPVAKDSSGTYSGAISFSDLAGGASYFLEIVDEKETVYFTSYLNVGDFQKPLYDIAVEPGKLFYTANETVDMTLSATFYNGTPAPGLEFNNQNDGTIFSTDLSGVAVVKFNEDKRYFDSQASWQPQYLWAYFNGTGIENTYYYSSGKALVFPRSTMLRTQLVSEGFENRIVVKTNAIDTSAILSEQQVWENFPQNITGQALNIPVDVNVYRVDYIKTLTGTYLDPIAKLSEPIYQYDTKETLENRYTVNTLNGEVTLSDLPNPQSQEQYYRIEVSCKDADGRAVTESVHIGYYTEYRQDPADWLTYRFTVDKAAADSMSYYGYYQYYDNYGASFGLGEQVGITLFENDLPMEKSGKVLYTLVQDSIMDKGVISTPKFSFTQELKHIPELYVRGAYFDGRHVYSVERCTIRYDAKDRTLSLKVAPDKESYRPGDKVTLTVSVADQNGAPVATELSVGVVDEAVFAVAGQSVDPIESLYNSIYGHYRNETYTSYRHYSFKSWYPETGGGKGGGGDGDSMRSNFKDTAQFLTGKTDATGKTTLSFKLPDDLTSWRVTAVAVTDAAQAGVSLSNIAAKLPLFVSPLFSKTYIEGDDVLFAARAYGENLTEGTPVTFTATVSGGGGGKEDQTIPGEFGKLSNFNFGKLAAGEYKVVLGATAAEITDKVEYAFSVKKTGLEMPITHEIDAGGAANLAASKYPIWLGFYDKQYYEYINTLNSLSSARGNRVDQQIAAVVANSLMEKYSDNDDIIELYADKDLTVDFADYQNSNGGIRAYIYDYEDIVLTARVAVAAPELFDQRAIILALNRQLRGGAYAPSDTAAAIMGLAALKQPVLTDAKALLKNKDVLSDNGILYLILALAYLGDTDGAQAAFDANIAPKIESNETWAFYNIKSGQLNQATTDDLSYSDYYANYGKGEQLTLTTTGANLRTTALVLLAAQQLGFDNTDAFLRYVRDNSAYDASTLLEQTAYLARFVPKNTDTAVVAFNRGLFPTTLELKKGGIRFVPFSKNQLVKSNITVKNGDVGIVASLVGTPDHLGSAPSGDITVTKTIRPESGSVLKAGELALIELTVTLGDNAPAGEYKLAEWVPSSLRYSNTYLDKGIDMWLESQENQRLMITLYHASEDTFAMDGTRQRKNTYRYSYLARCVMEGESTVDSTYVIGPSAMSAFTAKSRLTTGDAFTEVAVGSK